MGRAGASNGQRFTKAQINSAALAGAMADDPDGVEQALTEIGLDPTVVSTAVSEGDLTEAADESTDGPTTSPDYVYGDPDSSNTELTVATSPVYGESNQVWATVSIALEDAKYPFRNSWWCPDAIGFGFNDSDWAGVGEPNVQASDGHNAKFTAEDVAQDALAGTIELKDRTPTVGDPVDYLPDAVASLTGKFELRDGGVATTVWGSYTHTFAPEPSGAIDSISGGSGGLGVTVSLSAAKAWSKAQPTDPSESL